MDGFLKFFFNFISEILGGFGQIFGGLFGGIAQIFNIGAYVSLFNSHAADFTVLDWILSIVSILLVIGIFALIVWMIILLIRKYIRFRKSIVGQEDLLEELAELHRQVIKMTEEKDKIMAMKVSQLGLSSNVSSHAIEMEGSESDEERPLPDVQQAADSGSSRFFKLKEIDDQYISYTKPLYDDNLTLSEICDRFRNFACSRMNLYYDIKILRLFFAGLGSTKMILLQGISGTGKTSLPYSFGKFLGHDATIASVQPSWRDRTELFGYFNEFTKKFNETEVLKRIYDSSYNDDINVIILDEMNIARVEYYFAEMLSILEMPNTDEWKLDLVPSVWPNDPKNLESGKLVIPSNMWYIGTANNDDSTFSVSDKVYDRAQPINLDAKGIAFDAPDTAPINLSYTHLGGLFKAAIGQYPVSDENMKKIGRLDIYVIEKLRIAFGNRIMKQLRDFVPIYVACGGTELDGIDYVLATKVFRKFESLNLSLMRDEFKDLSSYLSKSFGKDNMQECKAYLERLQKMY